LKASIAGPGSAVQDHVAIGLPRPLETSSRGHSWPPVGLNILRPLCSW
jgi:hypothetical protein